MHFPLPIPASGTIDTLLAAFSWQQHWLKALVNQPNRLDCGGARLSGNSSAARGGDVFACLPDGADRDIKSDGCVKILSVTDRSAIDLTSPDLVSRDGILALFNALLNEIWIAKFKRHYDEVKTAISKGAR